MTSDRAKMDLQRLLQLPWTVARETTPEGDVLLRVKEIPSAVGSGSTDGERVKDLWESLTESLRAYLHFGDPVPMPRGASDSWTRVSAKGNSDAGFFIVSAVATDTGALSALA